MKCLCRKPTSWARSPSRAIEDVEVNDMRLCYHYRVVAVSVCSADTSANSEGVAILRKLRLAVTRMANKPNAKAAIAMEIAGCIAVRGVGRSKKSESSENEKKTAKAFHDPCNKIASR